MKVIIQVITFEEIIIMKALMILKRFYNLLLVRGSARFYTNMCFFPHCLSLPPKSIL